MSSHWIHHEGLRLQVHGCLSEEPSGLFSAEQKYTALQAPDSFV